MSKLFFAAALGLAALPVGAAAQTYAPDIHVAYADLDLSSPAGVAMLDRRISRATATICDNLPHSDSFRNIAVERCRKTLTQYVEPQRQQVLAARGGAAQLASTR